MTKPAFFVGIDLGTTNSALAYIPLTQDETAAGPPQVFAVPQLVSLGEVDARPTLPSFLLLPSEEEVPAAGLGLPWRDTNDFAVGTFAQKRGAELPHRLVSSAKSWLTHSGIDRTAECLPHRSLDADANTLTRQISPLDASARYLSHLRSAWDAAHPKHPLAEQTLVLTIPASFDPAARELTVSAARKAGLDNATLLEEPQAAFYAFLADVSDWRKMTKPGDTILVCDIGGGTTDFSLIAVGEDQGNLVLERVAVGDHILLGGDNMDLALAAVLTQKLNPTKPLSMLQTRALTQNCQRAKETLLSENAPETIPITVLGQSSKLIGGSLKTELSQKEALSLLLDGFFKQVSADEEPQRKKAVGLRELGLPYASDPTITRHLAGFLKKQSARPTKVLFNGGVMKSPLLRARVRELLSTWSGQDVVELPHRDLDVAVAVGAAYFASAKAGKGVRIRSGAAHSYYIGVESSAPAIPGFEPPIRALCVVPKGLEEGETVEVPGLELGLLVGETAEFRFFQAAHETGHVVGDLLDPKQSDLTELSPITTPMAAQGPYQNGEVVSVQIRAKATEIGTLELTSHAKSGENWKLEYSLRANPSDNDGAML